MTYFLIFISFSPYNTITIEQKVNHGKEKNII